MTFSIFSHTTAALSTEVLEKCGDFHSDPEGELYKICQENEVTTTLSDGKRCIMEGNWSAMIKVYNSISKFLEVNFNAKPNQLTFCNVSSDDNLEEAPTESLYIVKKQQKSKVPDPIVYSISSDLFARHPKVEQVADKVAEFIQQETQNSEVVNVISPASDIIPHLTVKEEICELVLPTQDADLTEKDVGSDKEKVDDEPIVKKRQRKSLTPKKAVDKKQVSKKNNLENGQEKKNQKKPSSLKPKKSWSQKILQDEHLEENKEKEECLGHKKVDGDFPEEIEKHSESESDIDTEDEKEKNTDDEWIPENEKTEGFKIKGKKPLKLNLKKNRRSTRISKKSRKTPTEAVKTDRSIDKEPEETFFNCPQCSYVSKKKSNLREHVKRMHNDKVWSCEFCEKIFSIHKDLLRHEKSHIGPQLCCDFCGKMYKSRRTFIQHKKSHEENYIKPEYECEVCKKSFSTKYVLNYHMKSEHMGIKKQFLCPTCGKSFTQKNSYIQHANVHMGVKPYQCEHCGKSFSYEKSLKEHRYMHDDVFHFKCDVCSKLFRQKSALQIHRKIHNETKDHLCGVCGKGFTQRQALLRHERIHNGDKPFKCGLCSRMFSDASIIRRHMILVHKKHTKEWREDVICDLKGADDYWIEGKKPEGRIKRLPSEKRKKTESEETTASMENDNIFVQEENCSDKINSFADNQNINETRHAGDFNLQRPSNVINNDGISQSTSERDFMTPSLYNVSEEQIMKETAMYLRKNPPMLQPSADDSENDMLNASSISQYLNNTHTSAETTGNSSMNLDQTFNESFTNLHDRKSEERLTHPFQSNMPMRSGNHWTAEPYQGHYTTMHYHITNFPNYQNQ